VILDVTAGRFHVAGAPAVSRTWAEVAAAAAATAASPAATSPAATSPAAAGDTPAASPGSASPTAGTLDAPAAAASPLAADHDFQAAQPTYPFGAHVAVVEVDTETGDARLVRLIACDDAGRILNPLLAEGQLHGGLAQGAAQALYEQVVFDADGNPLTAGFADYAIVSAAELPSFELVAQETPTWVNALGAKGIGESGTIGSTPAVHNAVCDALAHLGIRHIDMPCTPERVWRAIRESGRMA
jgi:aerobic carbon-monoxide dehydrogenase large subunit